MVLFRILFCSSFAFMCSTLIRVLRWTKTFIRFYETHHINKGFLPLSLPPQTLVGGTLVGWGSNQSYPSTHTQVFSVNKNKQVNTLSDSSLSLSFCIVWLPHVLTHREPTSIQTAWVPLTGGALEQRSCSVNQRARLSGLNLSPTTVAKLGAQCQEFSCGGGHLSSSHPNHKNKFNEVFISS